MLCMLKFAVKLTGNFDFIKSVSTLCTLWGLRYSQLTYQLQANSTQSAQNCEKLYSALKHFMDDNSYFCLQF